MAELKMSKLTEFLINGGLDHAGRSLENILEYSDSSLEKSHDIIQWCFPSTEPSNFSDDAPVLTQEDIEILRNDANLKIFVKTFLRILDRWLKFYGMQRIIGNNSVSIESSFESELRRPVFLKPKNHNFLRLTRMLKSLKHFGFNAEAVALFTHLQDSAKQFPNEVGNSPKFWEEAVDGII
jgi:hypothetical protein